eukprot:CAMPEP_0114990826 /NCGR_PEP_ID=MMETSP0216-20121206/11024_1 /TAXON_ID=223996 /ORGANISM="Protocruzia adherens, Strain Boccale" /LENGTH=93 /DNA_ID=CAMNT_0002354069 /DNA_START=37 /DNA_END=315 /DNA_ORIENTATION=+
MSNRRRPQESTAPVPVRTENLSEKAKYVERKFIQGDLRVYNSKKISFCRTHSAIIGGIVAGIFGLGGFAGIGLYLLMFILTSGLISLQMEFKW